MVDMNFGGTLFNLIHGPALWLVQRDCLLCVSDGAERECGGTRGMLAVIKTHLIHWEPLEQLPGLCLKYSLSVY